MYGRESSHGIVYGDAERYLYSRISGGILDASRVPKEGHPETPKWKEAGLPNAEVFALMERMRRGVVSDIIGKPYISIKPVEREPVEVEQAMERELEVRPWIETPDDVVAKEHIAPAYSIGTEGDATAQDAQTKAVAEATSKQEATQSDYNTKIAVYETAKGAFEGAETSAAAEKKQHMTPKQVSY